jgi:hypothetical protein
MTQKVIIEIVLHPTANSRSSAMKARCSSGRVNRLTAMPSGFRRKLAAQIRRRSQFKISRGKSRRSAAIGTCGA